MDRRALVVGAGLLVPEIVTRLRAAGWEADGVSAAAPLDPAAIAAADVLLAVDDDDATNLAVALEARQHHPGLRLVLRQFERTIAHSLEAALPGARVASIAAFAAANYAAIALDPAAVAGVEFPAGRLVSLAHRRGRDLTPSMRVLRAGGRWLEDGERVEIGPDDEVLAAGPLEAARAPRRRHVLRARLRAGIDAFAEEIDPPLVLLLAFAALLTVAASFAFAAGLGLDPLSAIYFAVTTITTTGYGDVSLLHASAPLKVLGIGLMIAGVTLINLTTAFLATAFVRARWTVIQGTHRVHAMDHVVVCGAGRVGTRVVDYLLAHGVRVVVVDLRPSATLVRLARAGKLDVITGDATSRTILDAAAVERARAVIVVTDRDEKNVEVALALGLDGPVPIVMRLTHPSFARAVAGQLGLRRTRSPAEIAAPVIAALAGDPSTRAVVDAGGAHLHFRVVPSDQATGIVVMRDGDRTLVAIPVEGRSGGAGERS